MLTAKQETFIQEIVKGKSQRQAYKIAYNTENMKDETIDNKAYKLFKQNEIRARYEELVNQASKKAVWSLEKSIDKRLWLLEQIEKTIMQEDGVRQSTGSVYNQTLDAIDRLTLTDITLKDEKLRQEIEVIRQELKANNAGDTDSKITEYINKLDEYITLYNDNEIDDQ